MNESSDRNVHLETRDGKFHKFVLMNFGTMDIVDGVMIFKSYRDLGNPRPGDEDQWAYPIDQVASVHTSYEED